jgi:predicted acetyltransferase
MVAEVAPRVALRPVRSASDRELLQRLYPLYLHDLSAFTEYYDLDADGRWVPDHLPTWLGSDRCTPLLLTADGKVAGLALVAHAGFPFVPPGPDHTMGEFFVVARQRRRGVGRRAAALAFDAFPGHWRVEQLRRNTAATVFWREVIDAYTGGRFEEAAPYGHPVQTFTTPGETFTTPG